MNYPKKIILVISMVALFAASEVFGFSISPLKYHLTVAPGTSGQRVSLSVKNDSDQARTYSVKVVGAKQNEAGQLVYGAGNSQAEEWVRPEKDTLEVPAQKEEKVNYIITIPQKAQAGSYYLGLAVQTLVGGNNGAVGLSGQLIAPLLLQVAGIVNESLSIFSWRHPPLIVWQNHWSYNLSVKNNGNVELPIKGTIVLRDWRGKEMQKKDISLGDILLPNTGRSFGSEIRLSYGSLYLPGPYQAEVTIKYGRTGQTAMSTATIWYFPAYSILLVGVIIITGIYIWAKKRKHG